MGVGALTHEYEMGALRRRYVTKTHTCASESISIKKVPDCLMGSLIAATVGGGEKRKQFLRLRFRYLCAKCQFPW